MQVLGAAGADFERFGSRVATDIYELGRQCELNPPYLRLQDAWAAPHNKVGNHMTTSLSVLFS